MTVLTGKFARINNFSTVMGFTFNDVAAVKTQRASNTLGGSQRFTGAESWNGSFKTGGAIPLVMPGESFTFEGYVGPDSGASGGTGNIYSGTAVVKQVQINWSWEGDGILINSETQFEGSLAYSITAGGAALTDSTDPIARPVQFTPGVKYGLNDAVKTNILPNVKSVTLTLTNNLQMAVNSSTVVLDAAESRYRLWQAPKPGHFDWTCDITVEDATRVLQKGEWYGLDLYIDDTDFWSLNFGRIIAYSGITFDLESDAIIQQTANIGMHGIDGATVGSVRLPGALTDFWP